MLPISLRRRRLPLLTTMVALGLAAAPAQASAAECPIPESTQSFARFGDLNNYFLFPGGSFEGSLTWAESGSATIVAGNEPFFLSGLTHASSLRLRWGGSVTTPKFCVTRDLPHLRFVAKAAGSGQLEVTVRVYGPDGVTVTDSSSGTVSPSDHAVWAPSRFVDLETDDIPVGHTRLIDVKFRGRGDWRVDNVMIDPYGRG